MLLERNHEIYHWTDAEHVQHDATLNFKTGFLNKGFFAVATILTIGLWSFLGWKMRQRSRMLDNQSIAIKRRRKKIYLEQYSMGGSYSLLYLH